MFQRLVTDGIWCALACRSFLLIFLPTTSGGYISTRAEMETFINSTLGAHQGGRNILLQKAEDALTSLTTAGVISTSCDEVTLPLLVHIAHTFLEYRQSVAYSHLTSQGMNFRILSLMQLICRQRTALILCHAKRCSFRSN